MAEIEERRTFLSEMRRVGQAKKYEAELRGEIAKKIKEMEIIAAKEWKRLRSYNCNCAQNKYMLSSTMLSP